jgi:hypothetical protein
VGVAGTHAPGYPQDRPLRVTTLGPYLMEGAMRIARALTIKVTLPLLVAGATLLSGAAVAVPSLGVAVNSAPVASAVTHGANPNMYFG